MPDTVCITGATGFVGRHLTGALLARGLAVRTMSRQAAPDLDPRVKRERGDLLDAADTVRFVKPGSVVVHLAYSAAPDPNVNLIAARNLVRACGTAGVRKLVHVSTATVVGRVDGDQVDEATPCNPTNEYERIKLEIERVLTCGCRESKVPLVILRPTAIFGPGGQNLVKLVRELDHDTVWLRLLRASLYGRRRLNLVPIENVVSAIGHVLDSDTIDGDTFFISDDHVPENNYVDVAEVVRQARWISGPVIRPVVDLSLLLPAMLRVVGRSNVNPRRVYRCEKLFGSGYRPVVRFLDAVSAFAAEYGRSDPDGAQAHRPSSPLRHS